VIACAKEKFWKRMVRTLGRPDLEVDPRYERFASRKVNAATLLGELDRCFGQRTTGAWLKDLTAAGVPCGPVNNVAEALADPLVAERQMIVETEHPSLGSVRQLTGLVRVGKFSPVRRRAPLLGEHTAAVLEEILGVDARQFGQLRKVGAFGPGFSASEQERGERGT